MTARVAGRSSTFRRSRSSGATSSGSARRRCTFAWPVLARMALFTAASTRGGSHSGQSRRRFVPSCGTDRGARCANRQRVGALGR